MEVPILSDASTEKFIRISSIPLDVGTLSLVSGTLNANTILTITWTTTAERPQRSLWNLHHSIRLGTNTAAHNWPNGASLTANQRAVIVTHLTDAISSDNNSNTIVNKLILDNRSADSFSYFNYFKAYSFAYVIGASS